MLMWAGGRQTHPCRRVIFSEPKYCTLGTKEDKNEGDHHGGATPLVPNTIDAISDISPTKSINIYATIPLADRTWLVLANRLCSCCPHRFPKIMCKWKLNIIALPWFKKRTLRSTTKIMKVDTIFPFDIHSYNGAASIPPCGYHGLLWKRGFQHCR